MNYMNETEIKQKQMMEKKRKKEENKERGKKDERKREKKQQKERETTFNSSATLDHKNGRISHTNVHLPSYLWQD